MREKGYDLTELHGDLESRERYKSIKTIQEQKKTYIVASDVASRGIDLEGITHVISCGFPKDLNFYIHRAGRTGRVNRDGICIALYQENDRKAIKSLENKGIHFEERDIRNHQLIDKKSKVMKKKEDPIADDIARIKSKKTKVKPNYKKKQKEEIDRLRRKKRREMIRNDIKRQQKERAKQRQMEKRS